MQRMYLLLGSSLFAFFCHLEPRTLNKAEEIFSMNEILTAVVKESHSMSVDIARNARDTFRKHEKRPARQTAKNAANALQPEERRDNKGHDYDDGAARQPVINGRSN